MLRGDGNVCEENDGDGDDYDQDAEAHWDAPFILHRQVGQIRWRFAGESMEHAMP